ncbi:hypothetical protein AAVH_07079 [Aphelenchoides avenae]|nr:hypothetical protein AAVH_07079 [Aphelenchus avenae]
MYVSSMVLDTCLVIVPLHTQWASRDELLDYLKVADTTLYDKAQKHTVIGIKHAKTRLYYVSYCSAITLALTAAMVGLWSTVGCYRYLRQNRSWISERTAALYRILINALVIEAFLGGALVITPALVSLMAFNAGYGYGAPVALMSFTIVNWYPLAANVVLVTYIRPYRIALGQLLQLGRKSSILPQITGSRAHKTVASSH